MYDDNNGSNNGNKGKWSERLYRMKVKYLNKNTLENSDEKNSFKDFKKKSDKIIDKEEIIIKYPLERFN